MKRYADIRLPFDHGASALQAAAERAGIEGTFRILRKSLDARRKNRIRWVYTLGVPEPGDEVRLSPLRRRQPDPWPIIVGAGPAGLFAAHWLSLHGVRSLVLEQGQPMSLRLRSMARYLRSGELDPHSNICFGAGGAGAYSDGKLNTRIRSPHLPHVMETLVQLGAPAEIRYAQVPHVGSNGMRKLIVALVRLLETRGVRFRFGAEVVALQIAAGAVCGVELSRGEALPSPRVLLCTGHSSRPLYHQLQRQGVGLQSKGFAVGARLEHPAALIDRIQFGRHAGHPALGPARYQLASSWQDQGRHRTLYSFCMCPGGYLLNTATEAAGVVTNGMSNARKRGPHSNAAMVVNVEPEEIAGDDPLRGLWWQQRLEQEAARAVRHGGAPPHALPAQRLVDFLEGRVSSSLPESSSLVPLAPAALHELLPDVVVRATRRGMETFGRRMPGLLCAEALMVGVETRTSSPVRVLRERDSRTAPAVSGLYPVGEGAGYAGGLVSAAVDGVEAASAVLEQLPRAE